MSSILDSAKLIKSIKRRAFIPSSQETFTDDDFLEMATEEVNIGLMEQIIEARGDYLVYFIDLPLIADKFEYSVPSRAHGNKLRDVSIVDENGKVIDELRQVSLEDAHDYLASSDQFHMKNNAVVIQEAAVKTDRFLRMWFYMRPNKLVLPARAGTIQGITDETAVVGLDTVDVKTLSFSSMPKHFTTSLKYDIVGFESPNKIVHYGLVPISINLTTKTITFLASELEEAIVGDYLTQAEETIVPNLPTEYHPIVAQRVAVACLEAMGDEQNKQSAERKLNQMEKSVLKIVTNRVEGAPKKIKQRFGTLNGSLNKSLRFKNRV